MILITKLFSTGFLGLALLASTNDQDVQVSECNVLAPIAHSSAENPAVPTQVELESASMTLGGGDQLEAEKQWDTFTMTNLNGTTSTLSASWVLDGGGVNSFWLNGTRYDRFEDGCYHPMYPERMWHYYKFEKLSPGKYRYEKRNAWDNDLMEKGSCDKD